MRNSKLARYLVVGIIAYLVEMVVLYGLRYGLRFSAVESVAISFWVGLVIAFVLQKLVTFKNYDKRAKVVFKQLSIYSILVIWNYGFSLLLVKLLSNSASVLLIRTFAILVTTSWNFVIYRALFDHHKV